MKSQGRSNLLEQVRKAEIFRDVEDDLINRFLKGSRVTDYKRGQILFMIGDVCNHIYFVIAGSVELYLASEDGTEVIFSELRAGGIMGEIEVTLDYRHTANAVVSSPARILEINRKTFADMARVPQISAYLMRTLARKLHETIVFAEGIALYPLETRLARLLLNLGASYGRTTGDGIVIDRPISQSRMGQLINASRPRVNAQLQSWKNERLIGVRQHKIVIMNQRSLQEISRYVDPAC